MSVVPKLRFSLPGLGQNFCAQCNEVTMHKSCRCVHCGTALPIIVEAPQLRPGTGNRKPELAAEKRQEIRRRALAGENTLHLLHEYGISYSTLQRAVRGHR